MKVKFTIVSLVILVHTLTAQPLNPNKFAKANSVFDELNPILSPDGKTLFVTIANHPQNMGGKKDPGDIWYCTLEADNTWSSPVHGGSAINDRAFNGIAGFSQDGVEMFLLTHYDPNGGPARTQGISVSKKNAAAWSKPQNITIPYFQNKSDIISGYITPNKAYFVFSAETYGTYGVEDLFICERRADGKWSEPINLGPKINTQFQEVCPFITPDGKTLFFSSNGRKGKGSFDIFSSTRLDDSWSNWSEPQNMNDVNSEGRDLYYRDFPGQGYSLYTSTKNSDGYGDMKMYTPDQPYEVDQTVVANSDETPEPVIAEPVKEKGTSEVEVHGKVTNAKTGEPIQARIVFENDNKTTGVAQTVNADKDGYSVTVAPNSLFNIRIEAEGYISTREKLDIKTFEMNDLEMNFRLQPIEVGTTVNLKDVLFEQSKTALLPQAFEELDLVVSFLKNNPSVKIELSGHTDNRGVPALNVKLSQDRVDRVRAYLISKGIESNRISGKGYGGSKPVASNETEETRKLNRRVEFTIKKN